MYYIYALTDPRTSELRYVGYTNNPTYRLRQHTKPSRLRGSCHRANWIRRLLLAGLKPTMVIIETVAHKEAVAETEAFWIQYWRFVGCDLTNDTPGGEGGATRSGPQPEAEKAKRRQMARSRYHDTAEHKECRRCRIIKSRLLFYRTPQTFDGRRSECALCTKQAVLRRLGRH